ncbi:MAG TPA: D-alanine--D-alanine ligase family protein [Dehalococcoidia bacterium]|nr:D-alanine--D-alanine ligase family protein [Dehalococcoidia bacterium]
MPDRLRLGVIFGGRSTEHEVSVVSAQHVIAAADRKRFEVVPIGVTKSGVWLSAAETKAALDLPEPPFKKTLRGGEGQARGPAAIQRGIEALSAVDVVFPLVHGTHGEDGTLQGLLELLDIPYVGCGVAASAIGMDKALMKAAFIADGLPVGQHTIVHLHDWERDPGAGARLIEARLPYPCFVKPANGGSSVGVSKVRNREELLDAIQVASECDTKVLVEEALSGREVECAVLGNHDPEASPVGEVRYRREFYDYEAKYLDPATEVIAPTDLPADVVRRVQDLSLRAFQAIDGKGLSRVDFFLKSDGSLIIEEINTIPGFTPASMYPRLWEAAGVSYSELVTRLVNLALERHREKRIA